MKKQALLGSLIATGVGAVMIIVGVVTNSRFLLYGLVIYLIASGVSGFISGTKLTSFFNWEASSFGTGCLLFPLYIFIYPLAAIAICLGGWIFGLKKLLETPN